MTALMLSSPDVCAHMNHASNAGCLELLADSRAVDDAQTDFMLEYRFLYSQLLNIGTIEHERELRVEKPVS